MKCCSSQCPRYMDCMKAVVNSTELFIDEVENLYSYGRGSSNPDLNHWDCGPMGNYTLFIPRARGKHERKPSYEI